MQNQPNSADVQIRDAISPAEIAEVRALFVEYSQSLEVDLCFQNFNAELASLPGAYAPPSGCLLYCTIDDRVAGCIALRKIDDSTCEMKRLYIRPEFRGHGLGQVLVTEILDRARKLGYRTMRLDTLPGMMDSAIRLYREFGFYEIAPYYDNPNRGTLYMQINL